MPIPRLWTDEYLARLAEDAEIAISTQVNSIFVRFPLNVVAGTQVYDFVTNVTPSQRLTGIIRITWLGHTVYPVSPLTLRDSIYGLRPVTGDVQGPRPYVYERIGYGMNGIKFFPTPSATITYNNQDLSKHTGIRENVIVSAWRVADGVSYRIPDWVRETLVRYFVLSRAYKKEGKGQNYEAAQYYEKKYGILLERFKQITNRLYAARIYQVRDNYPDSLQKPPRPVLPSNFGTIVR